MKRRLARVLAWVDDRAGTVLIVLALLGGTSYAVQVNEVQDRTDCQADLLRGVSRIVALPATTDPSVRAERGLVFVSLFRQYEEC